MIISPDGNIFRCSIVQNISLQFSFFDYQQKSNPQENRGGRKKKAANSTAFLISIRLR